MWANGDQSTNAQWWPMQYGYQYPTQDSSADWASRAALWAQQRQAQEEMAKHHQDYYAAAAHNQPKPIPTDPPLPSSDGTARGFPNDTADPPLPPGETPPLPPKVEHEADNLETVAMEDEPLDSNVPDQGIAVTRLDYNHGQPVPLPEIGPPPPIPGMQTFDHNHGFTPAPGTQTFGHVPAQRFDYGHQSAHPASPSQPPSSHWYDYDSDRKHPKHFEADRHTRHGNRNVEPVTSHLDYASLSDIKKKALPLWIREGLEKMEREKQKKQEQELKKSLNSSSSSLSNIAGYDHGNVRSPVPSPEHQQHSDDEPDKSDEEKEEDIKPIKKTKPSKQHWLKRSPSKSDSSDDEVNYKSETEKQQELLLKMRSMLTEILLSVTNDELHNIAKESYNEALTAENKQLRSSGGLDLIKRGGALGVGDYGSDSESSEEEEEEEKLEKAQHPVYNRDGSQNYVHGENKSNRYSRSRSRSQESDKSQSQSNSPAQEHKLTQPGSSGSSDQESEISESSKKKKRRSKHKRKDRSPHDSPKGKSKHRSRRSRSRSRTPKKHKSRRRDQSRSHSPSGSRSSRKSKKHYKSTSRSPSRKHKRASRSSSRSPSNSRKHRRKSRSSSQSPSRRRREKSESESPHRHHRSRSSSSDHHRDGKRRHKGRSRSRSRSSSPRHRRH